MVLTITTTSMSVALITCATTEVSDAVVTPVVVTSSIVIATVACVVLVMVVAVIIDAPAPAPICRSWRLMGGIVVGYGLLCGTAFPNV